MKRFRISVREVDEDAWAIFNEIKNEERVANGKLLSDIIRFYAEEYFEDTQGYQ
ncbi:hypothetical protein KHP62_16415 [Rhodobacteraceae bacterium NNCM2]|nr:hypothetical protein [Coraliihabitans acroporae]